MRTPKLSGPKNMQSDLELFEAFENGMANSTLRVYSWNPPCISLGYSQNGEEEIDLSKAKAMGWEVVTRPTGGGIVFHNEAEVTYSLVTAIDNPIFPEGLVPSYKKISEAIIYALQLIGINAKIQTSNIKLQNKSQILNSKSQLCFSYPAEYEVVVEGRKIVGSAQKRGKRTLLQQGSIFVRNTPAELFSVLKRPAQEYNAISVEEILGRVVGYEEFSDCLIKGFETELGIKFNE